MTRESHLLDLIETFGFRRDIMDIKGINDNDDDDNKDDNNKDDNDNDDDDNNSNDKGI